MVRGASIYYYVVRITHRPPPTTNSSQRPIRHCGLGGGSNEQVQRRKLARDTEPFPAKTIVSGSGFRRPAIFWQFVKLTRHIEPRLI